ncbi:MAG: hypothetical protein M1819_003555 [Sarea resinae]|nr:MAG: hypothetical protein M1819_003555 [Sarea resinae]
MASKMFPSPPPPVSKNVFSIAGILTTVYGLDELSSATPNVACLWLQHPRLKTQAYMEGLANAAVSSWNEHLKNANPAQPEGLIAVSFDQRNHGSREVDPLANEAWRSGNPRHAQDMFSIYHGTALDTLHLLTHLSAYIFPHTNPPQHNLTRNLVLGISLGGHSAYQTLLLSPRFTSAIIIIGCPDFPRLMLQRAEKSKRPSFNTSKPPGTTFFGSQDFPPGLVDAVRESDPSSLLTGSLLSDHPPPPGPESNTTAPCHASPSATRRERISHHLSNKRMLVLSGGADKLVPYMCSAPFLSYLKEANAGWFREGGLSIEDIVYDGVGHETTPQMAQAAVRFIIECLSSPRPAPDLRPTINPGGAKI